MNQTFLALSLLAATAATPQSSSLLPAVPTSPKSAPPTLDSALRLMRPLQDGIALAVDAAKVHLPKDATAPEPGTAPDDVADAFAMLTQSFGNVTAFAPRTMVVTYVPPAAPNPYDGMPPKQVLRMLARSFTPAQWKQFLSDAGLGYTDLLPGMQQSLFQAFFPGGHLVTVLDNPTGPNDPASKHDLSGDALRHAHLRVGYIVSIALPDVGDEGGHLFANSWSPSGSPPLYFMMNALSDNVDHEFGATVRESLPNTLKPAALPILPVSATVPLDGLKTVDDLCARVSALTHLEIYADPRFGSRPLTIVGAMRPVAASSLLRAVALAVRGTYRKVGPAYVLTDDAVGLGTKHALWQAFEAKATAMLSSGNENDEYGPIPGAPFTRKDIPFRADPLALSPAQQSAYWKKQAADVEPMSGDMMQLELPLDQLTSVQQEAARHIQAQNDKGHEHTTLDGTILIQAELELELVLPALDGPVMVFQSYENLLPDPARTSVEEAVHNRHMQVYFPEMAPRARTPVLPGALRTAFLSFPHRAILLAATDTASLARSLRDSRDAGFNEVWLRILPDAPPSTLLADAVTQGKALGLTVVPEVPLLRWQNPLPSLRDMDIMGRTPLEADAETPSHRQDVHNTVTPFDPVAASHLQATVSALAAAPGIGGMVWDDLAPTGYADDANNMHEDSSSPSLGYAEAGRLAFLRVHHADPIDIYDNTYTAERANLSIPGFDQNVSETTRSLYTSWRGFRSKATLALAQTLYQSLPPTFRVGPARLPLLVPPTNSTFSGLYGSWDSPQAPPPTVQYIDPTGPDGKPLMGVPMTEHMASHLQYHAIYLYAPAAFSSEVITDNSLRSLRQAAQAGAHNILYDATASADLLSNLARIMNTPQNKPENNPQRMRPGVSR